MSGETIYALATPPGRGGIAVVRVSGPAAREGLIKLSGRKKFKARMATLCRLMDPHSQEIIDRGMVIFFEGPASYTGEDIAEYHLHGGTAVVEALLGALSGLKNHRLALPGEFTRRAFENGKMDLTAAEAVADLIDAETGAQKAQALSQMGGALSSLYNDWCTRLSRILAYLEADLDFPDEDLPDGVAAEVRPEIEVLQKEIAAHLDDNRRGERLRDGVRVTVIGAPNTGKSSLINVLAKRDVAIVSDMAGTTRDVIEVHLNLDGYPVTIADTAGLRPDQLGDDGHDAIESEGIRRALERARQADIKILLFDAAALPVLDEHTKALADENSLLVFNKSDLVTQNDQKDGIFISAQTGTGLQDLTAALTCKIKALLGTQETPSLTRRRHREALEKARTALSRTMDADLPELIAEDVRLAVRHIGEIIGRVDVEDLLDIIFRDFCIGK